MKKLVLIFVVGTLMGGCSSAGKRTGSGTGIGAAAGAGIGAVFGAREGNAGKGALIGAGIGALIGGGVGNYLDRQAEELQKVAETRRTEEGLVTKLKSDILFDFDKSELKPAAKANIAELAAIIRKYPEDRLTIVGHTDSKGKKLYNQKLSEKRARAVMNELAVGGVAPTTMQVVGMGDAQPIAPNDSASNQAQNRRVEIEIRVDEKAVAQK